MATVDGASMTGISLCMIVRDEAENLPRCLESALPWVDEVCIVDTGSTDDTVAIAERLGARVEHFEWCDDFAQARNASLAMATEPWVLVLDADETITEDSGEALKGAVSDPEAQAWLVFQDNEDADGDVHPLAVPRLFRNRPEIRFSRPVHESVMESLREIGFGEPQTCDVHLHHTGYLPEVLQERDKYARNVEILRRRVAEVPNDLFSAYKLATSLRGPDRLGERLEAFAHAASVAAEMTRAERREYLFLPLLHDGYADCLIRAGDLTTALRTVTRGLADVPHAIELIWRRGDIAWRVGDSEAADRYLRACFRPRAVDLRYATRRSARSLEPARRLAGIALDRGDVVEASRHLSRALSFSPDDAETHSLAVRAALVAGDSGLAMERLHQLLAAAPADSSVRLLAGELAWMQADFDAAADLWQATNPNTDEGHTAHCWLAIARLAEGRFDEAEELLETLTDRDLNAAAARLVVAIVCGRAYARSNAFRSRRLLARTIAWIRELIGAGASDALGRFAINAAEYSAEVPGIERLLEADETLSTSEAGR